MDLDTAIRLLHMENLIRIMRLHVRDRLDLAEDDRKAISKQLDATSQVILWAVARSEADQSKQSKEH